MALRQVRHRRRSLVSIPHANVAKFPFRRAVSGRATSPSAASRIPTSSRTAKKPSAPECRPALHSGIESWDNSISNVSFRRSYNGHSDFS